MKLESVRQMSVKLKHNGSVSSILVASLLVFLGGCKIFLSPFLDVMRVSMSAVSFLAQLGSGISCLQNAFF